MKYYALPLLIIPLLIVQHQPYGEESDARQATLLTQHTWVKAKAEIVVPTHRAGTDLSAPCQQDDRYVFKRSGVYYRKDRGVRCSTSVNSTGRWELLDDGTLQLLSNGPGLNTYVSSNLTHLTVTRRIVELTRQRLRISVSVRQHGSEIMRILETYYAA